MGKSIVIGAIGGGVGKTTVANNIANLLGDTILVECDPSPKTHINFLNKINEQNIIRINEDDALITPNEENFQNDYESCLSCKEAKIKELRAKEAEESAKNPQFLKTESSKLEQIADKEFTKPNLEDYIVKVNDNRLGIIGGGLSLKKHNSLLQNPYFFSELERLKTNSNIVYDTAASIRSINDLSIKLMTNADYVVLITSLENQRHAEAYRLGKLLLWSKLEKSLDKKNLSKILGLVNESEIDEDNYLTINDKIDVKLKHGAKKEKRIAKLYSEALDSAKKDTNLYVIMNKIRFTEKINVMVNGKVKEVDEKTAAECYFEKLKNGLAKKGISAYCLAMLPASKEYENNRLITIPQTDINKKPGMLAKFFCPETLYEGFEKIVYKIKNNQMEK